LADRLEIGERHLRRLFRIHIGAAPVTVAQTRRVLLAKQLIHQTRLSMIQVALASGFGSVRRFNETFQRLYRRRPSELRRHAAAMTSLGAETSLLLPYRAPYDWDAMMCFLKGRAISGGEMVTEDSYSRVIEMGDATGSITVTHAPEQSALRVVVRFPSLNTLPAIIARVRRMFDLSADPGAIASALSDDPDLAPLISARPGLRVPGGWDGFEIAVRAVLGQQITVTAATQLAGRIVSAAGTPVSDSIDIPGLTHAFPRPRNITAETLACLRMPKARAACIAGIALAAANDPRLFDPRRDLDDAVAHLCKLPGIGEWTAQYIAMRALGESDAFLAADVGVQRKLAVGGRRPTTSELLARAHSWRPWRAYAVLHLWMADADIRKPSLSKETYHALTA
jgi:AraC family transcriptional regulator of adaptative response / DNA-3-methyladenine glycosylase II